MGDKQFVRQGADLHMQLTISLLDALTGFNKKVRSRTQRVHLSSGFFRCEFLNLNRELCQIRHLDGHEVLISSSEVTKPGQVDVIKHEGMPLIDDVGYQTIIPYAFQQELMLSSI